MRSHFRKTYQWPRTRSFLFRKSYSGGREKKNKNWIEATIRQHGTARDRFIRCADFRKILILFSCCMLSFLLLRRIASLILFLFFFILKNVIYICGQGFFANNHIMSYMLPIFDTNYYC